MHVRITKYRGVCLICETFYRQAFEIFDVPRFFRHKGFLLYNIPWVWLNCPLSGVFECKIGDGLLSVIRSSGASAIQGFLMSMEKRSGLSDIVGVFGNTLTAGA